MLHLNQTAPRKAWLVGHRGAAGRAPENTMASFKLAQKLGADLVECDVHVSKDGRVIVIHDASLERTTDRKGRIKNLTAAQICRADAGAKYSKKFRGERVPLLSDLLSWAKNQQSRQGLPLGVVIEIKHHPVRYPGIEKKVVAEVLKHGMEERAILIAFDHAIVKRAKAVSQKIATGILYDKPLKNPFARAKAMKADAIFPRRNFVTKQLARKARKAGVAVATWTVNERPEMKRIVASGIDAITTNFPDILSPILGKSR